MVHLMADELVHRLRNHVINGAGGCHFHSWLVDGSSVVKRKLTYEAELYYLRIAPGCVPVVNLMNFTPMKEYVSVNGENLYHSSQRTLLQLYNPVFKTDINSDVTVLESEVLKYATTMVGISADGAAVNFGHRKGLISRWKKIVPWSVGVHCFSHRLELAVQDGLKQHYGDVEDFLTEIYLYFRNSPTRWSCLAKLAESLNIKLFVIPKPTGTRLVAHKRNALYAIRWNWVLLVLHFSNIKENGGDDGATAAGYLADNFLNFRFYLSFRQFEDVLNLLSITSKVLQYEEGVSIADALNDIRKLRMRIDILKEVPGEIEQDLLDKFKTAEDGDDMNLRRVTRNQDLAGTNISKKLILSYRSTEANNPEKDFAEGFHLTYSGEDIPTEAAEKRNEAICKLEEATKNRFEEMESQVSILSHIKWIDHTTWPKVNPEGDPEEQRNNMKALITYGVADVKMILNHFSVSLLHAGIAENNQVVKEFNNLKERTQKDQFWKMKCKEFWPNIYRTEYEKFKNILLVVELIFCLPFSNAIVERGFSSLRRIITDWRSLLSESSVRSLMHISARKESLKVKDFRERLVKDTAARFISGSGSDADTGLSVRRIKNVLKHFNENNEPLVKRMRMTEEDIDSSDFSDMDIDD